LPGVERVLGDAQDEPRAPGAIAKVRAFLSADSASPAGIVRRRLSLAAKIAVTVIAFWIVFSLTDVGEAVSLIQKQNPALVLVAALAVLAQITFGSLRWREVLIASARQQAAEISVWTAFRVFYASIFFNSFLPSVGGDVVRAVSTRALGVTTAASVHSVVLDRMLTLVALLLMAAPALPLVWGSLGFRGPIIVGGIAGIAVIGILYLVMARVPRLAPIKHQVDRVIVSFWRALINLLSHPGRLLLAAPLAIGAHAAFCLSAYVLAQSIGIALSPLDALTLMPLVLLIGTIPISIGGWGVREVGAIGLLGIIGVGSHEAVLLSVELGFLATIISLPGALFWLAMRDPKR
jgi:uncharacterized protein (TIRG00374 family)